MAATDRIADAKRAALQANGCEVLMLPAVDGRSSVEALLAELGRRRFTNVLVEGGAGVFGSFLDAGAIDEFHVYIAPRLAGGSAAFSAIGGTGVGRMMEALRLVEWTQEGIEGDLYIHGWRA